MADIWANSKERMEDFAIGTSYSLDSTAIMLPRNFTMSFKWVFNEIIFKYLQIINYL